MCYPKRSQQRSPANHGVPDGNGIFDSRHNLSTVRDSRAYAVCGHTLVLSCVSGLGYRLL